MALHHRVIAAATSGQSHLIVGVILLSFVVWVTLKGNLGKYLTFLGFGTPAPSPQAQSAAGGATGGVMGGGAAGALGGLLNGAIPPLPGLPSLPVPGVPGGTPPFNPFPGT